MKLVVFGARGLLGRHLVGALSDRHAVTALGHTECDIADARAVADRVGDHDAIVNCAAFTNVDGAESAGEAVMNANALGPENLARAARVHDAKLLHVSTDFVFDGERATPYEIDAEPRPLSAYGRSKLAGEERVEAIGGRVFIARVQALYGAQGTGFASRMLDLLREGRPLKIDAERRVQPSFVRPVAAMLSRIVESESYGRYHVSCCGETTWAEFADRLCNLAGVAPTFKAVRTHELPAPAERPRYCAFSHHALKAHGFGAMPSWQDGLDDYLAETIRARCACDGS